MVPAGNSTLLFPYSSATCSYSNCTLAISDCEQSVAPCCTQFIKSGWNTNAVNETSNATDPVAIYKYIPNIQTEILRVFHSLFPATDKANAYTGVSCCSNVCSKRNSLLASYRATCRSVNFTIHLATASFPGNYQKFRIYLVDFWNYYNDPMIMKWGG